MTLNQLEKYRDDCIKSLDYWKEKHFSDRSDVYARRCYYHYCGVYDNLNIAISREKIRLNPNSYVTPEKLRPKKSDLFFMPF